VANLYEARLYELRGKDYTTQSDLICKDELIPVFDIFKPAFLDSVFQLMAKAKKEDADRMTASRRYRLIATLFIDVVQLELLSEKELSNFFNDTTTGKLTLSYFSKYYSGSSIPDINQWIQQSRDGRPQRLESLIVICEWVI
jgi:hypothetical protein